MPYARFRRNRYNRRNRRYRRRNLSTYSILSRKSATAQAFQINSVNKKINNLSRKLRPDIKQLVSDPGNSTFSNGALSDSWKLGWFGRIPHGNGDAERLGDKVFMNEFRYMFRIDYYNDFSVVGLQPDSSSANVRVIAIQCKSIQDFEANLTPNDILAYYSTSSGNAMYNAIPLAPLKPNITEKYNIIFDRNYAVSELFPLRQIKVKLPLKYKTWRYDTNGRLNHGVGIFIIASGLTYSLQANEVITFTDSCKFVYNESRKR